MKLLEATGWKQLPLGEGTLLANVKYIFQGVLKNSVTELELTNDEFATFNSDWLIYYLLKRTKRW